jgi:cold shock CspA family protein
MTDYGTIRKYIEQRGFGFIKGDRGEDTFFHISNFSPATPGKIPSEGTRVSYRVAVDDRSGKSQGYDVTEMKSKAAPQVIIKGNDPAWR